MCVHVRVCVHVCAVAVAAAFIFNAQNLQHPSIVLLLSNYRYIHENTYTRHQNFHLYQCFNPFVFIVSDYSNFRAVRCLCKVIINKVPFCEKGK